MGNHTKNGKLPLKTVISFVKSDGDIYWSLDAGSIALSTELRALRIPRHAPTPKP